MNLDIKSYNEALTVEDRAIGNQLASCINKILPVEESKIWHRHPVWFIEGNPIVGYSKQKAGIRLMFWSGADFEEPELNIVGKKFKDASIFYTTAIAIDMQALERWLSKAKDIQWDYKNIVKRKGKLVRLS
jgi:hypothetical protein